MKRQAPPTKQRGVALLALLVMLILAGGYAFYRTANIGSGQTQERDTVLQRLAQAKEAVIAYAVNDATRPGRLLCPDLIGDGASPLLSRDDCDSYGGMLPWKTLGLAENSDNQSGVFRYYLSPLFGGQRNTPVLNSETATALGLDIPIGSSSNDIAAVIIATRGGLDTRNADGDNYFYSGTSNAPEDNDIVIAITRQELMAAVEQRIANALRSCLEQHVASADNAEHTYPWPAPLTTTLFKGTTGSLFGMVPDTQPGNPGQTLQESITKLTNSKNSLIFASTVADQLSAATLLQAQTGYARSLYDRLFVVAADLSDKAYTAKTAFAKLDGTQAAAVSAATPTLKALLESLENSGFDLFLMELQLQNTKLKTSIDATTAAPTAANFTKLLSWVNLFKNDLLYNSATPNSDITATITVAQLIANGANAAVRAATNDPQQALNEATNLYNANRLIESTVLSNRVNIDSAEASIRATGVSSALQAAVNAGYSDATLISLVTALESARALTSALSTGSLPLNALRTTSLSALDSALAASHSGADHALVHATVQAAATRLTTLSSSLSAHGDNVARETLKTLATSLSRAPVSLSAKDIDAIRYWSDIAISQTADLARLARKGIAADENSDTSAYTAANRLLASLDGKKDTLALLEKAKDKHDDTAAQRAAQAALNKTLALLDALLNAAGRLDAALDATMAQAAVPTVWQGAACAFLQPGSGSSPPWWTGHGWKNLFFYQISDRIRPVTGQLSVNGSGSYRVVAISAGKALPLPNTPQNRNLREARSFLEKANADPDHKWRDGLAQGPAQATSFVVEAVSPSFNDRLAY